MVLMLGLFMSGLAYATWSETLWISGSVATGSVDWYIATYFNGDPYPGPGAPPDRHCNDGFEPSGDPPLFWWDDPDGKNVGWTEVTLVDSDGDGDTETLDLTLHNVYPSYFNMVSIYPHNNGTVPLIIDNVIISSDYGSVLLRTAGYVALDLTGEGDADIEISWKDSFGYQMEPCDWDADPELSFWIHVLQAAPQGATLYFTIGIVAVQYNLYDPPNS